MRKREYPGIDRFRLAAAMMVIAIHTAPFSVWNDTADFMITYCVCRVAVPFFFMVTGCFVLGPYLADRAGRNASADAGGAARGNISGKSAARAWKFFRKNMIVYLAVTILYLPLTVYSGNLPGSFGEALRDVFFDGTFYHLWYFPAVLLGMALMIAVGRFSVKCAAWFSITAYVIGVFGDSYYGIVEKVPVLAEVYRGIFAVSSYTRNGIFFAPLFLMLGALCRRIRMSGTVCRAGLGISFLILLAEGYLTYASGIQKHNSMYFALPFVMFFLFRLLLDVRGRAPAWARDCSLLVYVLHPAVIVALRGAAEVTHTTKWLVDNTLIEFVAVCAATLALSLALQRARETAERGIAGRRGDS